MSQQTAIASKPPCWLTSEQKEQAHALEELGFSYCGGELDEDTTLPIANRCGDWEFHAVLCEPILLAVCNNAVYSCDYSNDTRQSEEHFYGNRLKEMRLALGRVRSRQKKQREQSYKQLRLAV